MNVSVALIMRCHNSTLTPCCRNLLGSSQNAIPVGGESDDNVRTSGKRRGDGRNAQQQKRTQGKPAKRALYDAPLIAPSVSSEDMLPAAVASCTSDDITMDVGISGPLDGSEEGAEVDAASAAAMPVGSVILDIDDILESSTTNLASASVTTATSTPEIAQGTQKDVSRAIYTASAGTSAATAATTAASVVTVEDLCYSLQVRFHGLVVQSKTSQRTLKSCMRTF